jgi:hypothetical protein
MQTKPVDVPIDATGGVIASAFATALPVNRTGYQKNNHLKNPDQRNPRWKQLVFQMTPRAQQPVAQTQLMDKQTASRKERVYKYNDCVVNPQLVSEVASQKY